MPLNFATVGWDVFNMVANTSSDDSGNTMGMAMWEPAFPSTNSPGFSGNYYFLGHTAVQTVPSLLYEEDAHPLPTSPALLVQASSDDPTALAAPLGYAPVFYTSGMTLMAAMPPLGYVAIGLVAIGYNVVVNNNNTPIWSDTSLWLPQTVYGGYSAANVQNIQYHRCVRMDLVIPVAPLAQVFNTNAMDISASNINIYSTPFSNCIVGFPGVMQSAYQPTPPYGPVFDVRVPFWLNASGS